MRKAFSLLTAVFVMLLMATVSLLVFNVAGKITKTSTAQYQREQAALLARSYTELAIMAIIDHNRTATGNCIENIDGVVNGLIQGAPAGGNTNSGSGYRVQTRIYYLGNDLPCSQSRLFNDSATEIKTTYKAVEADPDEVAAVIIDVYIQYRDPSQVDAFLSNGGTTTNIPANVPWVTYHRRTLQKI
jgi:hypothetical protein